MPMLIRLSMITADRRGRDFRNDTDEPGEAQDNIQSMPCMVNPAAIRCFYPRKNDRPGTRITFTDGGGFAVSEAFDTVANAIYETSI